jgi:hypothetical protein
MTIVEQLWQLGWKLECEGPVYRASCQGFYTPWRETQAEVMADVSAIKGRENAAAVGPQKARW